MGSAILLIRAKVRQHTWYCRG